MNNLMESTNKLTLQQAKNIVLAEYPTAICEKPTLLNPGHSIKVGDHYFHARESEIVAWRYLAECILISKKN